MSWVQDGLDLLTVQVSHVIIILFAVLSVDAEPTEIQAHLHKALLLGRPPLYLQLIQLLVISCYSQDKVDN